MRIDHLQVGGHAIAGLLDHQVTGDQVDGVDLLAQAVADDGHPVRHQVAERLRGPVGPVLLHEGEDAVEDDDHRDGHAQLRHAAEDGQPGRGPQQQREEVHHLGGQEPHR